MEFLTAVVSFIVGVVVGACALSVFVLWPIADAQMFIMATAAAVLVGIVIGAGGLILGACWPNDHRNPYNRH